MDPSWLLFPISDDRKLANYLFIFSTSVPFFLSVPIEVKASIAASLI